jgi:ABC-2 type transport system permease protein
MLSVEANELLKTYRKWRTYIGFIAIAVVVPLVQLGLRFHGGGLLKAMTRGMAQEFLSVGNLFNAYFVTTFIMNSLWVHIPFLISLVAGDQLAGEGTAGTFRLILIRPTSRTRILFAKYITTLCYAFTLVFFLAGLSIGLGLLLFGAGDLLVPGKSPTIIPQAQVPLRLLLAFGLATWCMWCVASLAFLFSSLVENAIGPIIGTMTVIIVFFIISNIPVDLFVAIRPYLFTTYFDVWQKAIQETIPWSAIGSHVVIVGAFSAGFCLVTWYIFVKKDILS